MPFGRRATEQLQMEAEYLYMMAFEHGIEKFKERRKAALQELDTAIQEDAYTLPGVLGMCCIVILT